MFSRRRMKKRLLPAAPRGQAWSLAGLAAAQVGHLASVDGDPPCNAQEELDTCRFEYLQEELEEFSNTDVESNTDDDSNLPDTGDVHGVDWRASFDSGGLTVTCSKAIAEDIWEETSLQDGWVQLTNASTGKTYRVGRYQVKKAKKRLSER